MKNLTSFGMKNVKSMRNVKVSPSTSLLIFRAISVFACFYVLKERKYSNQQRILKQKSRERKEKFKKNLNESSQNYFKIGFRI